MQHLNSRNIMTPVLRFFERCIAVFLILLMTSNSLFSVSVAFADAPASDPSSGEQDSAALIENVPASNSESGASASTTPNNAPSVVTTGDATSVTESVSASNQNITSVSATTSSTSVPLIATTTVNADNSADVSNMSTTSAETGANGATGSGPVAIGSGNAFAAANVINVVNTNIVDSNGFLFLLNRIFGGTLDLSHLFEPFGKSNTDAATSSCSLVSCTQSQTTFNSNATNTASIDNAVVVRAATGGNSATSSTSALVETGNAYAAANVFNVANLNIEKSNYLLISVNNLGDLIGDIILPGKEFFANFFSGFGTSPSTLSVTTNNMANIVNDVSTNTDTGGNVASTTLGKIDTGTSTGGAGITNVVNSNQIGGRKVYILLRVYGDWGGKVFGLPEGVSWSETPNGVEIISNATGTSVNVPGVSAVAHDNTASISNAIQVTALTGDNHVDAPSAQIKTGNAYAAANVVNLANTNIVGENWIFAIFNILGNFSGNISFGRPNLWIGTSISLPGGQAEPGSNVAYTFTIANRGDADANHVRLALLPDSPVLQFDTATSTGATWDIGTIRAGTSVIIERIAHIATNSSGMTIPFTAHVTSDETDSDLKDNTDNLPLTIATPSSGGTRVDYTPSSDLRLTSTSSASAITAPGAIDVTLKITNRGGPAYHSILVDTITDPHGTVISQKAWNLDTIKGHEDITVTYTATFGTSSPEGFYTNHAQVKAISRYPDFAYGNWGDSEMLIDRFYVNAAKITTAAVPDTKTVCEPYMTSYIGPLFKNGVSDVQKLQRFLQEEENIPLKLTGRYDSETKKAVAAFQEKHREITLDPWGVKKGTGVVYYTTQHLINELHCKKTGVFSFASVDNLKPEQLEEISKFRRLLESTSTPQSTDKIGLKPVQKIKNKGIAKVKKQVLVLQSSTEPLKLVTIANYADASSAENSQIQTPKESNFFTGVIRIIQKFSSINGNN